MNVRELIPHDGCGIFYTGFFDGSHDYNTAIINLHMRVQQSIYVNTTVHTHGLLLQQCAYTSYMAFLPSRLMIKCLAKIYREDAWCD